jgi:beta-glucuronidase
MMSIRNKAFEFLDVICLNRYYGWYTEPGEIKKGVEYLSKELDKMYRKFGKPIILSEFGADTIPGWHAQPPEMFSEEYQVEFLTHYINLLNSKKFVVGQHVWNLCDFQTPQGIQRVGAINYKGVFTRDRRPKMAAHLLRKLWSKK